VTLGDPPGLKALVLAETVGAVTVQKNWTLVVRMPSETETVESEATLTVPVGVPLITPVVWLMLTPAGRPAASNVRGSLSASLAVNDNETSPSV
jgi:hypothetical protein